MTLDRYEKARFRGGLSRVSKGRQFANKVSEQAVVVYTPSSPLSAGLMCCRTPSLPSLRPVGIIYVAALELRLARPREKFSVRIYSYSIISDAHHLRYLEKVLREALLQFSGLENDVWQRHLKRHRTVARIQCALIALDDWMGPPGRTSGAEKG